LDFMLRSLDAIEAWEREDASTRPWAYAQAG
jgi:hypothetical protein